MMTTTRPRLSVKYVVKKIDISGYVTQRLCEIDRMSLSIYVFLLMELYVSSSIFLCVCVYECVCVDGVP